VRFARRDAYIRLGEHPAAEALATFLEGSATESIRDYAAVEDTGGARTGTIIKEVT
jgi:hypothetical protein